MSAREIYITDCPVLVISTGLRVGRYPSAEVSTTCPSGPYFWNGRD